MKPPLISIFLPYYNDEKYIKYSIDSVLNQTYENFELILFNHASTDKTRDIAHSYDDKRIIHIDSPINYGAGSGLNFWNNLPQMKGDFVKIFCADDVMSNNHLEKLVNYITKNEDKDFVISTKVNFIDNNNNLLKEKWNLFEEYYIDNNYPIEWQLLKYYMNSYSPLPWGSALIKKKSLDNLPKDNSMIYLFDMSFWVNLLINKKMGYIEENIISYRKHSDSTMNQNENNIKRACYYEHFPYLNLFYNINDMNLIKYLCSDLQQDLITDIKDFDKDIVSFLISLKLFNQKHPNNNSKFSILDYVYKNCAYAHLYELFQDEASRIKIQKKFNFTIKDFRDLYKKEHICNKAKLTFKEKLFSIKISDNKKHTIILLCGIKIKIKRKKF